MGNGPGVFNPSSVGSAPAGVGTNTSTGLGGTEQGNSSIYIPSEFSNNRGGNVPGLYANAPIPGNSHDYELGVAPGEQGGPTYTLEAALQQFLKQGAQDPKTVEAIQQELIQANYLNPKATSFAPGAVSVGDATYDAYANLLNDAIVTQTPVTQLLQEKLQGAASTGAAAASTTSTENLSTTEITNPEQARAYAQSVYENLLGVRPNDKQAAAFNGALDAYERSNPAQESVTDSGVGTGALSRTTNVTEPIGAAGAEQIAQDQIIQGHGKQFAQAQGNQIYQIFASMLNGA